MCIRDRFVLAQEFEGSRVAGHEYVAARLLGSSASSLESELDSLSSVKAADVSSAAQALLKGKPSSVALGNVKQLPYADELF